MARQASMRVMRTEVWIGVDVGVTGAVAILPQGGSTLLYDTPTLRRRVNRKQRTVYDPAEMLYILQPFERVAARVEVCIEHLHANGQNGSLSNFSEGLGVGYWHMAVVACGFRLRWVSPPVWKRFYGLIGCDKEASRQEAIHRFNASASALTKKRHHGRAEALLLAHYARSMETP